LLRRRCARPFCHRADNRSANIQAGLTLARVIVVVVVVVVA
jgi:hypothetical protein